jgi:V-type H+-transporting ATPase subunit a
MSSLFRSEEMSFIKLYIPLEIAQQTVWELGENGNVEFRDLNPDVNPFQRVFVNEIKRLDDMERICRFLKNEASKTRVSIKNLDASFPIPSKSFQELVEIEVQLQNHEQRLLQMNESKVTLSKRLLELTELLSVLKETSGFFEENESKLDDRFPAREDSALLQENYQHSLEVGDGPRGDTSLGFVAGVLPRSRVGAFEKIMFRALRGNLYLNHVEIQEDIIDPTTEVPVKKNVFIIFAQGNELLAKIKKLCEALNATLYPVDSSRERRRENALEVSARIQDLKHVLDNTLIAKKGELISVSHNLEFWVSLLKKEKAVYHTLNFFNYDQNRKALIADGWCPSNAVSSISYCLKSVVVNYNFIIVIRSVRILIFRLC